MTWRAVVWLIVLVGCAAGCLVSLVIMGIVTVAVLGAGVR